MGDVFAVISFYLSLVFGLLAGMLAIYNIGRIGMFQFLYWLKGVPRSTATDNDNFQLILGSIGIPTSTSDIVASVTNLSEPKSFFDLLGYFSKHSGPSFSYISSILGKTFSKVWLILGLPSFVLSIVLAKQGYEYMPMWLVSLGNNISGNIPYKIDINNNLGYIICLMYACSYFLGRIVGSPQRDFNKARIMYESVVSERGYWFDNVGKSLDGKLKDRLIKSEDIYDGIRNKISSKDYNDPMLWQQLMTSFYQYALLYCTLGNYKKAEENIDNAEKLLDENALSSFWEEDEREVTQSQMYFLRGEILAIKNQKNKARELFNKSLRIDRNLGDKDGIDKNTERLEYLENMA